MVARSSSLWETRTRQLNGVGSKHRAAGRVAGGSSVGWVKPEATAHQSAWVTRAQLTLPTKVPSDSLGRIGSLKRISDKSLFLMALGSCGHRITHQLRPINMNGRSILSVTSILTSRTE